MFCKLNFSKKYIGVVRIKYKMVLKHARASSNYLHGVVHNNIIELLQFYLFIL